MTTCRILTRACQAGECLPLAPESGLGTHILESGPMPAAGWELLDGDRPLFLVPGRLWLAAEPVACAGALLRALAPVSGGCRLDLEARKRGHAIAVITLSDKGACGQREDGAGPLAAQMLAGTLPAALVRRFLLPDDLNGLRALLTDLALFQGFDLVCTCGGTGLGPRDISPQATAAVADFEAPGFGEAMRAASLAKTPNAIISRATGAVLGSCLLLNLPGSVKAVRENLAAILPCLDHALTKLQGDTSDCGA